MKNRDAVMAEFVRIYPSFNASWEVNKSTERDPHSETVLYSDLTFFAQFMVNQIELDSKLEIHLVFETIERLLLQGDSFVSEAISVGLLEDIQNELLNRSVDLHVYDRYMQSETKRIWQELIKFWNPIL